VPHSERSYQQRAGTLEVSSAAFALKILTTDVYREAENHTRPLFFPTLSMLESVTSQMAEQVLLLAEEPVLAQARSDAAGGAPASFPSAVL